MTAFRTAPCRLCGRPIVWASSLEGKKLPLDPKPVVYRVVRDPSTGAVIGERIPEEPPGERAAMVSHFATCPNVGALDRSGTKHPPAGAGQSRGA